MTENTTQQQPDVLHNDNTIYRTAPMYPNLTASNTVVDVDTLLDLHKAGTGPPEGSFLFVIYLDCKRPTRDSDRTTYFTFKNKKALKEAAYHRQHTFGSIHGQDGKIVVILERSIDDTEHIFANDQTKHGLSIGERFAILEPRILGGLPNGAVIIETDQPLHHLIAPTLPTRDIHSLDQKNTECFNILKHQIIVTSLATLHQVHCNGSFCDRNWILPAGTFITYSLLNFLTVTLFPLTYIILQRC
jgi:hypothetical protein